MTKSIVELAKECGAIIVEGDIVLTQQELEAFADALLKQELDGQDVYWLIERNQLHGEPDARWFSKRTWRAGSFTQGYIQIRIDGSLYYAHCLAWLYVYGVWATNQLDHKDTIRHHNWIENLRDVTNSENAQNRIKANTNNSTGFLGVSLHHGKYPATITIDGKNKYLGRFETPEEAHEVYLEAKRIHHSTCTI